MALVPPENIKVDFKDGANNAVQLTFSDQHWNKLVSSRLLTKIFAAYSLIAKVLPPVNAIGYHEGYTEDTSLMSINDAHALFKGIERPRGGEENGGSIYCFVIKASYNYSFLANMVCVAKKVSVPNNCVFVVYVKLGGPLQPDGNGVSGRITNWELVTADPADPTLPENYNERYNERIW